jgi:hypothetical protein
LLTIAAAAALTVSYYSDPQRLRERLRSDLENGSRYEFAGHERLPGPFVQPVGDTAPLQSDADGKCFSFQTVGTALWELVDDPRGERYRFSAEVRHDESAGPSRVGIYFGHRSHQAGVGGRHSFYALWFADRGVLAEDGRGQADGKVMVQCFYFERRPAGSEFSPHTQVGQTLKFQPVWPFLGPGPWRRVAVEVTRERVKAFWQRPEGVWETVCELGTGDLTRAMEEHLVRADPGLTEGKFSARAGLGLYVHRGKASFRRVVVEPLGGGE